MSLNYGLTEDCNFIQITIGNLHAVNFPAEARKIVLRDKCEANLTLFRPGGGGFGGPTKL